MKTKTRSSKDNINVLDLPLVAVRSSDVDINCIPCFGAYERCARIVKLDSGLLGAIYGLVYMLDYEDGTYSISEEFPVSMICDTPLEVISQINSLDDSFVCWGVSVDMLRAAAAKDVLIKGLDGYYR
ncbi:hypothetical protein OTK49_03525 [Vibrio coralliirubri]|uniref:hypothetical protein n=1 Tax=Vibrio coralliirubri TaxID=1516159 RepID=UPI0022833F84|nr:hypothetical protein [Vibrio coralliirubri]MCY9861588.1 hypothetical protein [Vibrio coralliirubri]